MNKRAELESERRRQEKVVQFCEWLAHAAREHRQLGGDLHIRFIFNHGIEPREQKVSFGELKKTQKAIQAIRAETISRIHEIDHALEKLPPALKRVRPPFIQPRRKKM